MQNNDFDSEKQSELLQSSQNVQNLRVYKIILYIEIFLIIVLTIANIAVELFYSKPNNPTQASDFSLCKHRTKEEILDLLENVTKDEAISIIKNMYDKTKCTPEGLLPEKFKLKSNEFSLEILYSYDDVAEVTSIAQDSIMGGNGLFVDRKSTDDFLIDETTEYYTIVSVDNSRIPCGELDEHQSIITCYRGISFNKKYLNYYEKVENNSSNDEIIFNDLSPDFVELALKVVMGVDIWNSSSLYDYYFEGNGDSFTLTGIYFGVGVDMNSLEGASASDIPYAINIYEKKLNLDKDTRKAAWEKHDSIYGGEASTNILKSFSLSGDDLVEIQAVMYRSDSDGAAELKT